MLKTRQEIVVLSKKKTCLITSKNFEEFLVINIIQSIVVFKIRDFFGAALIVFYIKYKNTNIDCGIAHLIHCTIATSNMDNF